MLTRYFASKAVVYLTRIRGPLSVQNLGGGGSGVQAPPWQAGVLRGQRNVQLLPEAAILQADGVQGLERVLLAPVP